MSHLGNLKCYRAYSDPLSIHPHRISRLWSVYGPLVKSHGVTKTKELKELLKVGYGVQFRDAKGKMATYDGPPFTSVEGAFGGRGDAHHPQASPALDMSYHSETRVDVPGKEGGAGEALTRSLLLTSNGGANEWRQD